MPGVAIPLKSSTEMMLCVDPAELPDRDRRRAAAIPQIKDGKVRALAVTGAERSPELPDVPSMAEAGYPGGQHQAVERLLRAGRDAAGDRQEARGGAARAIRDPEVSRQAQGHGGQSRRHLVRRVPAR